MADYAVDIDADNLNTSHAQIIDLVGHDRRVLDIGCWTGDTARVLMSRGCVVSGVEIDSAAAEVARRDLETVLELDLDAAVLTDHLAPGTFDVVVLGDVLEHLVDPVGVLRTAASLLAPGGRVVISVPNVTHGSLRLALLQGRWRYTPTGLLDRTHIRFFDRAGLLQLVADAGLVVHELRGTLADPLDVEVVVDPFALQSVVVEWVRDQPDALVYQFVLSAGRPTDGAGGGDGHVDPPVLDLPASPLDVRRHDEHTEAFRRDVAARREMLSVRDHIIGLEAATTAAEERVALARARVRRLRARLAATKKQNERLRRVAARQRARADQAESVSLRTHATRSLKHRLGR